MKRQGDVLIIPIKEAPDNLKKVKRDKGRIVLAYGEATGHAHAIKENDKHAELFQGNGSERFLKIYRQSNLVHEEHDTINLEPGNYKIVRQREYTPERIRYVAD